MSARSSLCLGPNRFLFIHFWMASRTCSDTTAGDFANRSTTARRVGSAIARSTALSSSE